MPTPAKRARELIDAKLTASGRILQPYAPMNLGTGRGMPVTELPGANGPADYLLHVDGKALGVAEAKPIGGSLRGVEGQPCQWPFATARGR